MTNPVTSRTGLGTSKVQSYRGNSKLKRANSQIQWTPQMISEFNKCESDPIYFCENYVKIVHVDDGLVPFKPRPYQKKIIKSLNSNRFTIVSTCRQAGKTTSVVGALLHYIIFNDVKTVALLANKAETAREILGRVQLAYENLPAWLQHGVIEYNKGSFELENGSRIMASATSSQSIRGFSINLLFIDEAAHIENWDEFFTSTFPTISSGQKTKVCLVSTPNGMNHFYKLWSDANNGKNEFNPIYVDWRQVPGRDEKWATREKQIMGADKFRQEHEVQFLGASNTLINPSKLEAIPLMDPIDMTGRMKVYEKPIKDRTYVLCADVAHGRGIDYSAFNIVDVTELPYRQVAVYRDNLCQPVEFTEIIYNAARRYGDAQILCEVNDVGQTVVDMLYFDWGCETLIPTTNKGRDGKRITTGGKNYDFGIRTTKATKAQGCTMLKEMIENDQLIIRDVDTVFELSNFAREGKSYEATDGNHDDIVMSLVLFGWLIDQPYFKQLTDTDLRAKLRLAMQESAMQEMVPIGFMVDGLDEPGRMGGLFSDPDRFF